MISCCGAAILFNFISCQKVKEAQTTLAIKFRTTMQYCIFTYDYIMIILKYTPLDSIVLIIPYLWSYPSCWISWSDWKFLSHSYLIHTSLHFRWPTWSRCHVVGFLELYDCYYLSTIITLCQCYYFTCSVILSREILIFILAIWIFIR